MPRRHSQNNTANPIFTHYEKSQLKGIYGTIKKRLTRESMKPFDACSICLQAIENPLSDKEGHIYCKQCIYQYLLEQKNIYKQKMKEYKAQQIKDKEEALVKEKEKEQRAKEVFDKKEARIVADNNRTLPKSSVDPKLKSFWLPSLTPEHIKEKVEKPSKITKSPFGHPIKLKDLLEIKLTPINGDDEKSKGTGLYMCPACNKSLNNVTGVCCIKTTGHVYCKGCMDTIIIKDLICPVTSTKFTEEDIMELEAEGSSFAGRSGEKLEATVVTPAPRL
eukprot:TRINITY_DN311_c0_g1_i9.p1 TRINITY_DN311_c0_g1~~TRINITY_DN311_c0_g1_i9.p1  ORF type:complete len:277 (-),score=40.30 TRINITY_DN311_c0_g1_i9:52-882(-)